VKGKIWKHGITGCVCVGLGVFYCALRNFGGLALVEKYRTLCDAFTVPGLLCLCVGVLLWVSGDGFFCGLGYCLNVARKALLPGGRKKMETYYAYLQRHRQKPAKGYGFLFLWGGICMTAALVFLLLFYR